MIKRTTFLIDDNDKKEHYLLFSVIEHMLPSMQDSDLPGFSKRGSGYDENKGWGISLHIDNINDQDDIFSPIEGKIQIKYPSFVEEPQNKEKLYISENSDDFTTIKKVLPTRHLPYFVHCYIDKDGSSYSLLNTKPRYGRILKKLCMSQLGFDIMQNPEHIGNIYEVFYNNVLSSVHFTASDNPYGVILRLNYIRHQDKDLVLNVTDRHQRDKIVIDKEFRIPANQRLFFADLPCKPYSIEVRLYDNNHNLLYYQSDMHFIRSISLNILIQQLKLRIVDNRDTKDKKQDEIVAKFSSADIKKPIAKERISYENYFEAARMAEKQRTAEKELNFIFFDGASNKQEENTERGREIIKQILDRANQTCYIVDPYFNEKDFVESIYKMKRMDIDVRIINCRDQLLKTISRDSNDSDEEWEIKRNAPLLSLNTKIEEFKRKLNIRNIECRTRLGRGDIHDRFIFADNIGWTLGSSFSELGNRCTTIQKIPNDYAPIVLNQIQEWWNDTKNTRNLNVYVDELKQNQSSTSEAKHPRKPLTFRQKLVLRAFIMLWRKIK